MVSLDACLKLRLGNPLPPHSIQCSPFYRTPRCFNPRHITSLLDLEPELPIFDTQEHAIPRTSRSSSGLLQKPAINQFTPLTTGHRVIPPRSEPDTKIETTSHISKRELQNPHPRGASKSGFYLLSSLHCRRPPICSEGLSVVYHPRYDQTSTGSADRTRGTCFSFDPASPASQAATDRTTGARQQPRLHPPHTSRRPDELHRQSP